MEEKENEKDVSTMWSRNETKMLNFVGKCGAKYEVKQENTNKCQKCGHLLDGQMKFCPNCGFHVENEKKVTQ